MAHAKKLIAKYGEPDEVASQRLIWQRSVEAHGARQRRDPARVPGASRGHAGSDHQLSHRSREADELLAYDGSVILERTKGELAARCDREEANFLAINLAYEIATGRRKTDDARAFYAESIKALMSGTMNDYVKGVRFTPPKGDQGDPDKPFGATGMSRR